MTSLTDDEIALRYPVSDTEVFERIKSKRMPYTKKTYGILSAKVRRQIRAAKLRHAPGAGVSVSYGASAWQIVYGTMKIGGVITFAATRNNNQNLDLVVTLAGHQITSLEELWLDDERVVFGGTSGANYSSALYQPERNTTRAADNKVYCYLNDGNPSNTAISALTALQPTWTPNHKQSGRAHIYVALTSDPVLFPNGLPTVTAVVRGKLIYDPLTTGTFFTNNAAACILDYLTNTEYGMGISLSDCELDITKPGNWKTAINICGELVTNLNGGTEIRYPLDGAWSSDASDQEVLEKMSTAMAGAVVFSNGKWKCFPGAAQVPSLTLSEKDLLSDLSVTTKISRRDSFNGVRGTFTSAVKGYVEDDFPAYKNDYYKSQDNNERIWEDIQLPLTQSPTVAQRIAKIFVEKVRQQITVQGTFALSALKVEVGEVVYIANSRLGWLDPRENLLAQSETFTDTAFWILGNCTITPSAATQPDHIETAASKLVETVATGEHRVEQYFSATSGETYRVRCLVKAGERTFCRLYLVGAFAADGTMVLNLGTGAILSSANVTNATVVALGSGWYEMECTVTANATATASVAIHAGSSSSVFSYAGDITKGIYIAAFQVWRTSRSKEYVRSYQAIIQGGVGKRFQIENLQPVQEDDGRGNVRLAVELSLQETASAVYDWNNGEETSYDVSANTTLPDPYTCAALTGLTLASGTAQLYITQDGTVITRILASWSGVTDGFASSGGLIELEFKKSADGSYNAAIILPVYATQYYILDVQDGVLYDVRVRVKNAIGIYSAYTTVTGHLVVGKTAVPSNITSLGYSILPYGIVLGWQAVTDLDIDFYEIRVGASADIWSAMEVLTQVSSTTFEANLRPAGTYKFAIKAVDTTGNYSATEAIALIVIGGPATPVVTAAISGPNFKLSWTTAAGQFQIQDYIIRYGTAFSGGTEVATILGNTYEAKATWSGTRTYWVAARDVAGNISTAGQIAITITAPGAVTALTGIPIDNNVLIKFTAASSGTLPIAFYRIYKGAAFSGASLIGEITGTFTVLFETVGGTFTYWVAPYDTAGNLGAVNSVTTVVSQPPDYVLLSDITIGSADWTTLAYAYTEGGKLIGCYDSARTWANQFTGPYSSFQDLIDDGYLYYIEPMYDAQIYGYGEKVIDYGTTIGTVIATFSANYSYLHNAGTSGLYVQTSPDGSTWTAVYGVGYGGGAAFSGDLQLLLTNFRYIKVAFFVNSPFSTYISILENCRVRLDVKTRDDSGGPVTAAATNTAYTATMTIANPCVVTATAHGFAEGTQVVFTTSGALPTGIVSGTTYIVRNPATNTFNLSASAEGTLITTTGSQSGVHTVTRQGTPVFFAVDYYDVDAVNVTLCPTAAQLVGITYPLSAIVNLLDAPKPKSFNVLVYDGSGTRRAMDFRWSAKGV